MTGIMPHPEPRLSCSVQSCLVLTKLSLSYLDVALATQPSPPFIVSALLQNAVQLTEIKKEKLITAGWHKPCH
jgi:hypothetical protein